MGKTYLKKIISALFITLIVASVASASNGFNSGASTIQSKYYDYNYDREKVVPGDLMVYLREPYYTIDDEPRNIAELFPELNIDSFSDINLSVLKVSHKPREEWNEKIVAEVGMHFVIHLTERTVEATEHAIEVLKDNPIVDGAEPNFYYEIADTTPNDPYYASPTDTPQWGLPKIGAPAAWDYLTGSDATDGSETYDEVKVAVIDTGIDNQHPDLVNNLNMSLAYDACNDNQIDTSDSHGHGTHVAGIIGAEGNNSIGVVGVCWNVDIIPIRISSDSSGTTTSDIMMKAIKYVDHECIMISNMSVSLYQNHVGLHQAIRDYSSSGGLLILSAGNDYLDIDDSISYSDLTTITGVIIVGALDYDLIGDYPCLWSNYGDTVVDLFAPGESIVSTVPNNSYDSYSGTSMAAPFVTGVAALIKSAKPQLTNSYIKSAILNNTVYSSDLVGLCNTSGRLCLDNALTSLGYHVSISNTIIHGSILPSAIFTPGNTVVYIGAWPDSGYLLKPGTLKYNSNAPLYLYDNRYCFVMPYSDVTLTAQFYLVGDADQDGNVTVADAMVVMRHAGGLITLTGDALLAADVDGNNDVDDDDYYLIMQYSAHLIDHFPIEE